MSATLVAPAGREGGAAARAAEMGPTAGAAPGVAADAARATEAALEWTFNPWRQNPGKAIVGALVSVAAAVLITRLGLPPLAVAALAIAFLATLLQAFLPAQCRVDAGGVARRLAFGWERRPWEGIRGARLGAKGLFVSPRLHPGPLESFRGLWLPLPADAPPALVAELRTRLAARGLPPTP